MIVLMYHGVLPDAEDHPLLSEAQVHAAAFDRQMAWLRRHARVLPLSEAVRRIRAGTALPPRATVITFDDGLGNHAAVALPILERYGLPATFFVATAHLEPGRLLWFNRLAVEAAAGSAPGEPACVARARLAALRVRYEAGEPAAAVALDLGDRAPDGPLAARVAQALGGLTREQVRALGRSDLVEVASHTVTHPLLTRCAPEHMRRELVDSRRELEALTGRPVRWLAYPQDDHDDAVVASAREAGYEAACAVDRGGAPGDLFRLSRVGVYGDSAARFWAKWLGLQGAARGVRRALGARAAR